LKISSQQSVVSDQPKLELRPSADTLGLGLGLGDPSVTQGPPTDRFCEVPLFATGIQKSRVEKANLTTDKH
jgi:hypothetical protein